jgi:hypothetical protein
MIQKFIVALALVFLSQFMAFSLAGAVETAERLDNLIKEYLSLPKAKNETLISNLLDNPMLNVHMANPTGDLKTQLDSMNLQGVERLIAQKQLLMSKIYQAAILEVNGPESSKNLRQLIFLGVPPGKTLADGELPGIDRLSYPSSLYNLIFLLLQREEDVQIIALDILRARGPRYPSTDSFARGLARFAAEESVNAERFEQILNTFDKLYALVELHPRPPNKEFGHYHIGRISGEMTNATYNPAFGDPKLQPIIIKNIFSQLNKHGKGVRADLLGAVASLRDNPEARSLVKQIMETSSDESELKAVLYGSDPDLVFAQLERFTKMPPVLEAAVESLLYPYTYRSEEKRDAGPLLKLLQHPSPQIRAYARSGLSWSGFSSETRRELILGYLHDKNEGIRLAGIGHFWSAMFNGNGLDYKDELEKIAKTDPVERVRKSASEVIAHLEEQFQRECEWRMAEAKLTDKHIN